MSKSRKGLGSYQAHVARETRGGKKTLAQAAASWRAMKKASGGSKTAKKPASTRKRIAKKSTVGDVYYGIGRKPKGTRYGKPAGALKARQVRRFGEYEVPHKMMDEYLVAHHMKPVWKKKKPSYQIIK